MLWVSPAWNVTLEADEFRGRQWLEFVDSDDLPRLLAWFASDHGEDRISFCTHLPAHGIRYVPTLSKIAVVEHWLCFGENTVFPA